MIVGSGIDIVEISRIKKLMDRYGNVFLDRIFTEQEKQYCLKKRNASQHLAGRFAAKEAFVKAFSSLQSSFQLSWKSLSVCHLYKGTPILSFVPALKEVLDSCLIVQTHLTISHSCHSAVAMVLLENE